MATLNQRKGGGTWYVDYYEPNGRRVRKSTGTTDEKKARRKLKILEGRLAQGQYGLREYGRERIRADEFIEMYLENQKEKKDKGDRAENTFLLDCYALNAFRAFIGNGYIHTILSRDIEAFKNAQSKQVSKGTINIMLRHISPAFSFAVEQGYIEKNPCIGVKKLDITDENGDEIELQYFDSEAVTKLLQVIPEGRFKDLILFYLYTGCRRNEALNLNWDDIDLKNGTVKFRKTKSGKNRKVPFNGQLIEVFNKMDKSTKKPFPFRGDFVTHKFKEYLRSASIENSESLCVHSLRHTYASHLLMQRVPIYTVSKLLGHSSVKVTEMYAHLNTDHLREAVKDLSY